MKILHLVIGGFLLATVASITSPIVSNIAYASGETYTFAAGGSSITATGGGYAGTTTYSKVDPGTVQQVSGAKAYYAAAPNLKDANFPRCSTETAVIAVNGTDPSADTSATIALGKYANKDGVGTDCVASEQGISSSFTVKAAAAGSLTPEQSAQVATAAAQETAPLMKLACGDPPAASAGKTVTDYYDICRSNVSSAYKACNTTGGSVLSALPLENPADVTKCLKRDYASLFTQPSADITAAIAQGRKDADAAKAAVSLSISQENCTNKGEGWTWNETANTCDQVSEDSKSTCAIDGIGWIVCPVMTFVSSLNDTMYGFIASMLVVETGLFDTSDTGPYVAWQQFQGIANVLFVVVFLVIIYSQVTSVGISNYGVKKLLPKLIVVAILVNISYFLCQLAVDVSNILGVGLKSMFDSMAGGDIGKAVTNTNGWTAIVGAVIAGVGGAALLLLAVSVPVLVSAFLALSMIILILIARKAIIVMLIVISPIAFVLYLLPNTEPLFKKWWKLFSSLLVLYPVIAVVFGASSLAATILMGLPGEANKIVALGASAIPLFVVPGMLKGALAATGKLGAKMQGWGDKATGRVGSAAKNTANRRTAPVQDAWKYRKQQRDIKRARKIGEGSIRRGVLGKVGGGNYSDKLATQAASLEENEFNEQVKAASSDVSTTATSAALGSGKNMDGDYDMSAFHAASDAKKAAIIEHVMAKGSFDERRALVEASGGLTGANASRLRKRISEGVYAKGDQNIYGSGIGSKIITGAVTDGKVLRKETLKNINDGHVSAEHLVQGESATEYMVDTATGATQDKFDSAGNQTQRGAATGVGAAADHASAKAALKASYTNAQTNTGTRSKLNGAYNATLGRVV